MLKLYLLIIRYLSINLRVCYGEMNAERRIQAGEITVILSSQGLSQRDHRNPYPANQ